MMVWSAFTAPNRWSTGWRSSSLTYDPCRHRSSVVELSIRNPARPAHTSAGRCVSARFVERRDCQRSRATITLARPLAPQDSSGVDADFCLSVNQWIHKAERARRVVLPDPCMQHPARLGGELAILGAALLLGQLDCGAVVRKHTHVVVLMPACQCLRKRRRLRLAVRAGRGHQQIADPTETQAVGSGRVALV